MTQSPLEMKLGEMTKSGSDLPTDETKALVCKRERTSYATLSSFLALRNADELPSFLELELASEEGRKANEDFIGSLEPNCLNLSSLKYPSVSSVIYPWLNP